jgi:hypothetical protein
MDSIVRKKAPKTVLCNLKSNGVQDNPNQEIIFSATVDLNATISRWLLNLLIIHLRFLPSNTWYHLEKLLACEMTTTT